ncbi:MAG TPA: hypothetical protein VLZ75_07755 [Chitinophagales bacterium]|nr:hypothetical protein [Chitinophagales bacterium]
MKKTIVLLAFICGLFSSSFADQILIYKTLADYKSDNATIVDGEVSGLKNSDGNLVYNSGFTVKASKKEEFYSKDFWGFKFKGILFRSFEFKMKQQTKNIPSYGFMALVSQGEIFYWENGIALLDILTSKKNPKKGYLLGQGCNGLFGLSKDLESDIYTGRFYEFFKKYPEYNKIPADYTAMVSRRECRGPFVPNLEKMNKLYDLGGTDEIAMINFYTGINNNFGKPKGITSDMVITFIDNDNLQCRRAYFKQYNGGNFEKQIEGSTMSIK